MKNLYSLIKPIILVVLVIIGIASNAQTTTVNFGCTGASTNWTVPPCVTSINVIVAGGDGGGGLGGNGAVLTATIPVTPGQVIGLSVGCSGNNLGGASSGGFGGGGIGFVSTDGTVSYNSSGGGGASRIIIGGVPYMIAAGGGGEGGGSGIVGGGAGGCATGLTGTSTFGGGATGGTQTAGGIGGTPWAATPPGGSNGGLGFGGMGGFWGTASGGGGGGGYYGGGGGGNDGCCTGANGGGGGGGGSSLVPGGAGCTSGSNNGPGYITITYTASVIVPTITSTNVTCFGGNNGTATANPSGGTYSWNTTPIQTTQTATGLPIGTYTVTVTVGGCTGTASVVITQPTQITVPNTHVNSTCGMPNGTATANPVGGVGPYTYSWNTVPVQTTQTATGLIPGSYTVTVTGFGGCTATATVVITSIGSISTTATSTNVSCFGGSNGTATANPLGGGPYTYSWNTVPIQTTQTATGLPIGTYTVTVTSFACTATATVIITQPTILNATTTQINVTCFGGNNGTATANPTGGTGLYTYSWNTVPIQTTQTATGLPIGTYTCTITDINGCVKTITVTITQPTQITSTISMTPTTCGLPNGSATVNPSGGVGPYSYSWNTVPVQTTQTATSLLSGTYVVTITGFGGCIATNTIVITNTGAPTVTIPTHVDVSCFGGTGSANSNVVGGVGPFIYSWNTTPIQTTANATGLPAGNYTLTVTGSNGCSATASVIILQPTLLTATNTHINVTCFGVNNGSATVAPSGGVGPYTYSWNSVPIQTTQTANALIAGTYICTITDLNGCQVTQTVTITQPTLLTSTNTHTNVTCFGGNNGTATVTPSGGVLTYTYSWNTIPTQTTQVAINLIAGTYVCTITDFNGCQITQSVVITEPTQLTTVMSMIPTTCGLPNGSATATPSGGVGPYTYSWNTVPVQTTQTATTLLAGGYTCTITDLNLCQVIGSTIITNTGAPTVTIPTHVDVSCFGGSTGSANSNVVGGVGPFIYSWNTTPIQTTANATGVPSGTYVVTVTGSNGCSATATVVIVEPTQLSSAITTINVSCFGGSTGSATATPSGGVGPYTYSWNSVPAQTTQTANGLIAGTFSCTVTDFNLCQVIVSANIIEPTLLSLSVSSQTNISCFGGNNGSISVLSVGGVGPNYLYSLNSGPNQLSNVFSGLIAGNYTITVTDQNGCIANVSTTLTQPVALSSTSSITDVTCFGSCDGQISLTPSGGVGPYNYLWSNGSLLNPLTGLCNGTYSVVITDASGCQFNIINMVVNQPTSLTINPIASPTIICIGQSSTITSNVLGGTGPYTYLWSDGSVTPNITVSPIITTTYNITTTDANLCTTSGSVTVSVSSVLTGVATALPSTICVGASSTLSAIGSGGNGGPYTYTWSPGGSGQTISVSPLVTTVYTVTISDGCSPSITTTVTVIVNPLPTITYTTTPLSGCEPLTVTYTNTTPGSVNCVWLINGTSYNNCFVTQTFPTQGTYNATLTVTDVNGCVSTSGNVIANVYPIPTASFIPNPSSTNILTPLVEFNNSSSSGTYLWDFGDGVSSTLVSPDHVYGDTGTYVIQLIVTTSNGCVDTTYSTVYIDDVFSVYVPNAFTPNGDGINDTFYPVYAGVSKCTFLIFNRWGEIIFTSNNGEPWDGTYSGRPVQQDVYTWKLEIIDNNMKKHRYIGHVTIVK